MSDDNVIDSTVVDSGEVDSTDTDTMTAPSSPTEPDLPRPRVRAGAIAWGLVVTAIGVSAITILGDDGRRGTASSWLQSLTPFTIGALAVFVVAAAIGLIAAMALLRRWQVRRGRAA